MADLAAKIERHGLWLSSHGAKGQLFFLAGADFRGMNVDGRNLSNAMMPETVFSGMRLTDVDLNASNLAGRISRGAGSRT